VRKPVKGDGFELYTGDCREVLPLLGDASIDAVVCDPPYEIRMAGKSWDSSGVSFDVAMWAQCLRVLKPGGHLLSFGHPKTCHRMVSAIEDAGFDIRDQIMWLYGDGRPISKDVSKEIDATAATVFDNFGALLREERIRRGLTTRAVDRLMAQVPNGTPGTSRNWEGGFSRPSPAQFNTACAALSLAYDAVPVVERPVTGKARWRTSSAQMRPGEIHDNYTVRDITLAVTDKARQYEGWGTSLKPGHESLCLARKPLEGTVAGNVIKHGTGAINIDATRVGDRHPANVIHDGIHEDWAEYYFCAKATRQDRGKGNDHITVKPEALMRYLTRLVCPPGGTVLDPFMGSGSTGKACRAEGFAFVGIESDREHFAIAKRRLATR
jgi:DNA modification methylase